MDAYSKDCLPGEQEKYARALGRIPTPQDAKARGSFWGPHSGTCSARPGRAGVHPGNLTPRRTPSSPGLGLPDS